MNLELIYKLINFEQYLKDSFNFGYCDGCAWELVSKVDYKKHRKEIIQQLYCELFIEDDTPKWKLICDENSQTHL